MSDVVPVDTPAESQVSLDASTESDETPATPAFDEATWKKRLAGKDQALTAAKREAEAAKAEAAALSKWKAELEQANMTELQKLQAERDRLAEEAASARAEAAAIRLASQYPLAAEILGDDLAKFDEVRVAEINGRLAKERAEESEPESRTDTNNPRRSVPKPPARDLAAIKADLTAMGNPWAESTFQSTNTRR